MLTYLKRSKGLNDRFICVMLSSFQLFTPILTVVSLVIYITQEGALSQIIKAYVTLSIVTTIDDMFYKALPADIKNPHQHLIIPVDQNGWRDVICKCKIGSLVLNMWHFLLTNFTLLLFNYFTAAICFAL